MSDDLVPVPFRVTREHYETAREAHRHATDTAKRLVDDATLRSQQGGGDMTAAELAEIEQLSRASQSYVRVCDAYEDQQREAAVNHTAAVVEGGALVADTGVPLLSPSADALRALHEASYGDEPVQRRVHADKGDQHRAAITLTTTGTPTVGLDGSVIGREPRRIAVAAQIPGTQVQGVAGTVFPVFGSADTAEIAAEGATKAEYDDITSGTATPAMIALWTDYTRQVALTLPAFEAKLRAKLAARVARREDKLVVARVLATTGIQTLQAATTSVPYAESLMVAAAMVLDSDVAATPNMALVNPADLPKIFPAATATGANGESPASGLRLDLHGLAIYPTSEVSAGAAIVGAWSVGSEFLVGMPPTYLVDSMSQLKSNKVTVLLEEAVTLAVTEPKAFVSVDLNGP